MGTNVSIQLGGSIFIPMKHLLAYGLDLVGPHYQPISVQSSPDSSHLLSMLTIAYGSAMTSAHGWERTGAGDHAFILLNIPH